jgi:GT2 family glycosyltransferase
MGRDGTNQFAARRFPSIPLTLLELSRAHLALGQAARGRILLGPYAPGGADLSADWVPGTAMFLRREAVEDVGLFSETFFMYGEDVELCWRMRRRGWTVAVPTHVSFRHAGRLSAERTWGAAVTRARMLEGWYRACSDLKGSWYASCLLWLDWLAASVEASLPWRSARQRALAGQGADALWGLLRPSARRRAM